jgi:hypothetical protein
MFLKQLHNTFAVCNEINRIQEVNVYGAVVYGTAQSQTGYSTWNFRVDFNNWGHVDGTYWINSDNSESSLPQIYGRLVSGLIQDYLNEEGITVEDFSEYVDNNDDLGTTNGLSFHERKSVIKRIFNKAGSVTMRHGSQDLLHEHLYPVISIMKYNGFKSIKTRVIKDVNKRHSHYIYEVEKITIGGRDSFERGDCFEDDLEVIITYHEKGNVFHSLLGR